MLFVTAILVATVNNRILENNLKHENIEIFIPTGMANRYKDLMKMSFDDQRIWEYHLNFEEIKQMKQELNKGVWKEFNNYAEKSAKVYFSDEHWPKNLSDELYFCMYSSRLDEIVYFSTPGFHRYLFLYDATNYVYYCVSKTI